MPFTRSQILRRYQVVLRVFSRYGFGWLADHMGLGGPARPTPEEQRGGRGERLRRAFEELGPAYVKLGQMLSTRGDLLPADIVTALERLQDQVSAFPYEQALALIEGELGAPLERHFRWIEPVPIAAASLGQVHEAVLADGRPVVIKVQRPGVREQVELDLQVLQGLAALAARRTGWGRSYDLPGVAREFAGMLRAELDYRQEGRNADRFRQHFADESMVRFPEVIWEQTTGRVLTLERVGGLRITDREGMRRQGTNPGAVAQRLAGAIFRMVLRDGFFHADPHPGNLFVGEGGQLIFVDMGMVGELTPAMRENIIDYVIGVVTKETDLVVDAILRMGMISRPADMAGLRRDCDRLRQKYGEVPIRDVQLGPALRETLAMARRYEISFPSSYTVLLKSLTTLEAVCRQVDPDATLVGLASPYAELVIETRFKPERILSRLGQDLLDAGRHTLRIPRQVSRLLSAMEEGEWRLALDHTGLEPALQRLSAIANRLAIAILLASLIIGTALVSSGGGSQSFLHRYPVADVGFLLIGAVGLWLILSILGSKRS
ncbi:MAG TPA: AarF/ABC1/UbiB kinase family protein [Symbiobacteriaceae bacterium]|nr:AarF/ABC1/UbiB kinase family protein [Symbiobacteriaceae bacterium]